MDLSPKFRIIGSFIKYLRFDPLLREDSRANDQAIRQKEPSV